MYEWLDKIVAEQAAFYGTTPEKLEKYMRQVASYSESIETGQVNEPERIL